MYVCIYACMYVYVCKYVRMNVCMYVCINACMHACTYLCMYTCMLACMHVWMYVCTYVRTYVCMYVTHPERKRQVRQTYAGRKTNTWRCCANVYTMHGGEMFKSSVAHPPEARCIVQRARAFLCISLNPSPLGLFFFLFPNEQHRFRC